MQNKENWRGVKFPLEIDPATGRFKLSQGADTVKESVYLILTTQKSERFTRPEFGSRIMAYAFLDPSSTRIHMMEREIKETIMEQEPRITDVSVEINQSKSEEIIVYVDYTTREEGGHMELKLPVNL